MKEVLIGFLKGNIKWIVSGFVIVVLIIFLASASYIVKLIDSSNPNHSSSWFSRTSRSSNNMNSQIENNISTQATVNSIVAKGNGDYKLDIDLDEKINELYDELSKTEDGRRKLSYLSGTEEDQKELLKDMVRVELMTQYPDLRTVQHMGQAVESNEIQGVIRFKRVLSEPTIKKVSAINKAANTATELNGGVVCWGDNFTLGNIDDSSDNYPTKLAQQIQKNAYNLGFDGTTSSEVALLAGSEKYSFVTTNEEDVTLGANLGAEVTIKVAIEKNNLAIGQVPFKSYDGSTEKKQLECTINGVDGYLIYKNDGTHTFKRKVEGEETRISKNSVISLKSQGAYKNSLPIIWIGNGNSYINYRNVGQIQNIAEDCWALINMASDPDNYLVIIPAHYQDANGQFVKYESNEYDAIKQVFLNSGFNNNQVLDLRDVVDSGYDAIARRIVQALRSNNILTEISGGYNQNVSNSQVISLSNQYLPSDGTAITLEYIPLGNKLQPEPGTLMWLINNEDEDIRKASMQYFSLDSSGNIVISNWSKVTTIIENFTDADGGRDNYTYDEGYPTETIQYTIVPSKVNYRDSISQYTLPFDYLWTLLVMSDDSEFVEKITKLGLNSSIEATLYDEWTSVDNDGVDELTNGYRTHYKEVTDGYEYYTVTVGREKDIRTRHLGTSAPNEWDSERYEDKKNHTKIITETNKIKYRLTYADVWNLTYKVDNIVRLEYQGSEGNDSVSLDNEEINDLYQKTVNDVTQYPVEWHESGAKRGPTVRNENTDNGYNVISHEEQDYTLVKDHVITTIIIKSGYKYTSGTTSVKEKTDKNYTEAEMNSGNFSDPNFVKYYIYCRTARNNIQSITSWLFTALENNSRTEGLVDITKYMLYKATDNDYGVTSMDFSAYNEQDFKDAEDMVINNGGNDFNDGTGGDGIGTGGDGSLAGDAGSHYWGVYKRGDKEYKCYYQNSYSGSMHNAGCVATAAAICHSGYGSTKTPMDFWSGSGATGCGITKIARNKSLIISYLNQNAPIVIYNSFPGGEFYGSSGGHAIVLVDVNSNGEVYVINPWHGSKWNGWYSLDYILSFAPGSGAPNTMGPTGVGVVLN